MADPMPEDFGGKTLKLNSPAGGVANPTGVASGPLCITWPNPKEKEIYEARSKEFIDTITFVSKDFPDILIGIKQFVEKFQVEKTYESAVTLVERYNNTVKTYIKINRGTEDYCAKCRRACDPKLADHVLRQVYRMSITDPGSLNKYESFTSATYGETNFKQMAEILQEIKMDKNDVFVDLGSGIGSIVMQASICTPISRAIGIEIQDIPNKYAHDMDKNFEFLMAWYGKKYSPYDLYGGSFMEPPSTWKNVRNNELDAVFDWKREATVIFVNNYAFSADLNLELKNAFNELNPGTRIVSTKEFCPVDFKINDRNAGKDIGSIMRVKELKSVEDGFSWTNNAVKVFQSTIDNTKLQEYYDSKSQKTKVKTSDRSSSSSPVMDQSSRTAKTVPSHKANLKQNAPTKKASKVKIEPIHESDPEEFSHVTPAVNGKKRPRKKKTNAKNNQWENSNGKEVLTPLQRFHRDQLKSLNNNPAQQCTETSFDKKIDETWNIVSQNAKLQFREMIRLIKQLPTDNLPLVYEKEKETIRELSRLVKREEEKINEIKRKTELNYERSISRVMEKAESNMNSLGAKMASEESQVMRLKEQMDLTQSRINAHPGSLSQSKHAISQISSDTTTPTHTSKTPTQTTVNNNLNRTVPKGTQQIDGQTTLPPRFTTMPQSPHSVSHSPRSIKSSPSSENKNGETNERLIQAGLESATYHTHISPIGQQRAFISTSESKPGSREHFPINLTPNRTNGDVNSCESGHSRSSSTYGSPRTKRPRLPSVDSNISEGIKPVQSSVIRPTNHLSTSNHNTSNPNRHTRPPQMIGQQSVVRLNGASPIIPQNPNPYGAQQIPDRLYGGLGGLRGHLTPNGDVPSHYLPTNIVQKNIKETDILTKQVNGVHRMKQVSNGVPAHMMGIQPYPTQEQQQHLYTTLHGLSQAQVLSAAYAQYQPYQVQYAPPHHPPTQVPPNRAHANQTQNSAALQNAAKTIKKDKATR